MNRTKRFITIVLICTFAVTMVLSGCGSSNTATDSTTSTVASTAADVSQKVDEPTVDLKWYVFGPPQKEQDVVFTEINKYLKEKINVTVSPTFLANDDYKKKLPIIIASGEEFDICFTASWINEYGPNVAKGAFLPLDDLIAQYGQGIKKIMPDTFWKGIQIDGKVYAIPANKELAHQWCYLVKKEVADKYSMDFSKVDSWDDIEPMLKEIEEKEPNLIPLHIQANTNPMLSLPIDKVSGSDTLPGSLNLDDKDGKIFNELESQVFKDYFTKMHTWFKAGYIRKDAATLDDAAPDLKAGKVFSYLLSNVPYGEMYSEKEFGYKFISVPIMQPLVATRDCGGSMNAISKSSKNPEKAMQFLEMLNTDQYVANAVRVGIENKHYVKVDENTIDFAPGVKSDSSPYYVGNGWMIGNMYMNYLFKDVPKDQWDKFKEFNESANTAPSLGFNFKVEAVKAEAAACSNVWNQYVPALATGSVDPAVYLPKAIEAFKKADVDKLIAEMQTQFDAWKSTKK